METLVCVQLNGAVLLRPQSLEVGTTLMDLWKQYAPQAVVAHYVITSPNNEDYLWHTQEYHELELIYYL